MSNSKIRFFTNRKVKLFRLSIVVFFPILVILLPDPSVKDMDSHTILGLIHNPFFILPLISSIWIFLNVSFVHELISFVKQKHTPKEALKEFLQIAIAGLANIALFAFFYYFSGIKYTGEGVIEVVIYDFFPSLYFSIVTWTTLGYGDYQPIKEFQLVAAAEALMGYVYMALKIGLLLYILQEQMRNHD